MFTFKVAEAEYFGMLLKVFIFLDTTSVRRHGALSPLDFMPYIICVKESCA